MFFKGERLSNKSAGSKSWCYFIKLLYDDDHDDPRQHYKEKLSIAVCTNMFMLLFCGKKV
jgi:hypothetical protein